MYFIERYLLVIMIVLHRTIFTSNNVLQRTIFTRDNDFSYMISWLLLVKIPHGARAPFRRRLWMIFSWSDTAISNWELYRSVQFSIWEQLLHRTMQWFRDGLVFKAHRLCVSLISRLESNKEEERRSPPHAAPPRSYRGDRLQCFGFNVSGLGFGVRFLGFEV